MCKKLANLEPVDLREIWETEAQHFTPWLAKEENLNLLGETLGMEFELKAQETDVGDFRADILCRNTRNGSLVLIENQLEVSDHTHLGQIMTYAAGLKAHTIIWIAKKIREEHRAALDHQNEITDERFKYFGIEIKVWKIGNSDPAPQFEIVSSPNTWSRKVSRNTNLTPREEQQFEFWTKLLEHMKQAKSQLQFPKPKKRGEIYFPIERPFWIEALQRRQKQKKGIAVSIHIEGENSKGYFNSLKEKREEIENEFEGQLGWSEKSDGTRQISLRKSNADPANESDWPEQHKWLATTIEKFYNVFQPRIKELNSADGEPLENEEAK